MKQHGLSSLELMRRLIAEEEEVGRTLDLHRWAEHLKTEDDITRLVSVRAHQRKVLVLDLDGTLWSGVYGDGGIGVFNADLVLAAHAASSSGFLLAVVSKNEPAAFGPASALIYPIAASRVNWTDKAENIAGIADELGLGLSSFVFVDDSPQERDRVSTALPSVVVLDPACDLWMIEAMLPDETTIEDTTRAQMYAEEREREAARAAIPDEVEWLRSLEMHVTTRAATEADVPRLEQLFERTNQFNSHPSDQPHWRGWDFTIAEARDRFGDYGIVGAASTLDGECDCFAMSCRVIGKGVAETLLSALDARRIRCVIEPGNAPLRRWLEETPRPFTSPEWLTHEVR